MATRLIVLLLSALAAPALAQNPDADGSKDHPMVPRLPAYFIFDYEATDFDKADFPLPDDKVQREEGKHWKIEYSVKDNARHESPLAILRNYQNAFQAKGGTVLFKDDTQTTLRLRTATGELWCHVDVANDGDLYTVHIIEKAAMAQQVELNATELAKALNEKGSIALHNILFDTAKATIKPESASALAMVGDVLKADAALRLEIQGHTDNVGAKAANLTLSQARAAAVRDYLIKTFGIAPDRLTASGLGDTKPIADNATEAGRAQNRRVELVKTSGRTTTAPPARGGTGAPGEWTGRVSSGLMAVGGETTGIMLVLAQDRLELQPADQAMRRRLEQLDGKTVTVRGTFETRQGVEVGTRRIIKVIEIVEKSV